MRSVFEKVITILTINTHVKSALHARLGSYNPTFPLVVDFFLSSIRVRMVWKISSISFSGPPLVNPSAFRTGSSPGNIAAKESMHDCRTPSHTHCNCRPIRTDLDQILFFLGLWPNPYMQRTVETIVGRLKYKTLPAKTLLIDSSLQFDFYCLIARNSSNAICVNLMLRNRC